MKKVIVLSLSCLFTAFSFAQDKFVPAREHIMSGIEAHDAQDYRKAINSYLKVKEGDTAYHWAMYEVALSYVNFEKPDSAIYYLNQGLKRKSEYHRDMMILLGQAYDSKKDYENGIKAFNQAVDAYPNSYKIYFERGVCYTMQKKYDLAVADFQKAIQLNPYYSSAHLRLGEVLLKNDQLVPGTLSTMHFLLLEPGTYRAQNALINLENYLNGEIEISKDSVLYDSNTKNVFATLDEMLRSKVALNDAYKTNVKLQYTILIKQIQLLCEKLKINKSNNDFWSTYYVPVYKGIWDNGHFESYMYYIFQSLNDKKVVKMNKKKAAPIQAMANYVVKMLKDRAENQTLTLNGKAQKYKVWFGKDGQIESCGNFDEKKQVKTGPWIFFFGNDLINAEGVFDNNGKKSGAWKEYTPDGMLQSSVTYKEDKANGPYEIYYPNGQMKEKGVYVNGIVEGKVYFYTNTGALKYLSTFKADKLDGDYEEYDNAGYLSEKTSFKQGKLSGPFTLFFPDGKKRAEGNYKDGEVDGTLKRYYYNGNLELEAKYVAGKFSGKYMKYYENKQVEEEGSFNDKGDKIGTWKMYFNNGQLFTEETYVNGKQNGTSKYFNESGKLFSENQYKEDDLVSFKYFDPISGKQLSAGEQKSGKLALKKYDKNGRLMSEGNIIKGYDEGTWKFYNAGNVAYRIENYKEGQKSGEYKEFFDDGKTLKVKVNYENDIEEGLYVDYFANGKVNSTGYFQNGSKVGEWVFYYPNGKMQKRMFFLDGEVNGTIQYFDGQGNLTTEEYYVNNSFNDISLYNAKNELYQRFELKNGNGDFNLNRPNQSKFIRVKFAFNSKDGEEFYYDHEGKITSKIEHKYGDNHGKNISYWANGKVKREINYQFGSLEGDFKEYYENGQLEKKYYNHNNSTEGNYEVYFPSGKLKIKGTFEDDVRDGKFYYYNEDGMLRGVFTFYNGALISYTYEDASGQLVPEIILPNATGKVTTKYKNGAVAMDFNILNGEYHGEYNVFYSNGKLAYRNTYVFGLNNGKEEEFYVDGKIKSECFNYYNFLDGSRIDYYPSGKKQKITNFSMDDRSGEMIYFDQNEKKVKVENYFNDIFEF